VIDTIMVALGRLSAQPEPRERGDRAAAAATSDAPVPAAAQQHDRGNVGFVCAIDGCIVLGAATARR